MKDFKKLVVGEKAHKVVLFIYQITKNFPSDERFGLISQLRRAATSTPSNIAEDVARFLSWILHVIYNMHWGRFMRFNICRYYPSNCNISITKIIMH